MFSINVWCKTLLKLCSLLTPQFEEQLDQGILNASDLELNHAVTAFFNEVNAIEAAQALDISADRIQALQLGASFKDEQYLADLKENCDTLSCT